MVKSKQTRKTSTRGDCDLAINKYSLIRRTYLFLTVRIKHMDMYTYMCILLLLVSLLMWSEFCKSTRIKLKKRLNKDQVFFLLSINFFLDEKFKQRTNLFGKKRSEREWGVNKSCSPNWIRFSPPFSLPPHSPTHKHMLRGFLESLKGGVSVWC